VLRRAAVIACSVTTVYWSLAAFHVLGSADRVADKVVFYALLILPAVVVLVSFSQTQVSSLRISAILSNGLLALWWVANAIAMPGISPYHILLGLLLLTPLVTLFALSVATDSR
jgi:hypothetical protein